MPQETSQVVELDRNAAADRLNDIASALRSGGSIDVDVGNKTITLDPPEQVNYRIDVVEKKTRFRGSRETVRIEIDWKP